MGVQGIVIISINETSKHRPHKNQSGEPKLTAYIIAAELGDIPPMISARAANIEKLCYFSDPFVMLTEHYGDDGEIYVFAINYHNRATKAHLNIKEGYAVETLYGSQLQNGILELKENDGALLKVKRICE